MTHQGQRGQSLVELMVGMSISVVVMAALVGVVYSANNAYTRWSGPIRATSASNALGPAVVALQADLRRYVPCPGFTQGSSEINLCLPSETAFALSYGTSSSNGSVAVTRDPWGGPATIVAGGLPAPPAYNLSCYVAGDVLSGWLSIQVTSGGAAFASRTIAFVSPVPQGGSPCP